MLSSLFRRLFLVRWLKFLRCLIEGVRVHPSSLLDGKNGSFVFFHGVKVGQRVILRTTGSGKIELRNKVWISTDVEMETNSKITVGTATTVQRRATINGTVQIGNGCIIAPNVFISSGTHPFREFPDKTIREQEAEIRAREGNLASLDRPIVIGDDCWLGVNVVICPGVRIGTGVVVGANSVVSRDIQDYCVVAGSPARVINARK